MSAQIISFPKLVTAEEGMFRSSRALTLTGSTTDRKTMSGLHLVKTSTLATYRRGSQQTALRIVADVCDEHQLPHPKDEHPDAFWAALPLPPARVETPVSVMRRLAHMVLPTPELA